MTKPKCSPTDFTRQLKKKKIKSASGSYRVLTGKYKQKIELLLDAVDPSTLSYRMRTCLTTEQLKEAERDPIAALLSFAINSGLGRYSDADHLHTVFELMKNPDFDSSVVPSEFKKLVAEIEAEVTMADTERIVREYNAEINKTATLKACASCGMRAFDMGKVHHFVKPISELNILLCSEERKQEIQHIDREFR